VWLSAIRLYDEALRIDPKYARAYVAKSYGLADLYRQYDRNPTYLEEAERLAKIALELEPGFAGVYNSLSLIYLQQKRIAESEAAARQFIELQPENFSSHFSFGFFYDGIAQPALAIPYYEESLRLKPDYLNAHSNLVLVYDRIGEMERRIQIAERALVFYEKRVRLFPEDENSLVWHANLVWYAGKVSQARENLEKLVESSVVKDGFSLYNLGCLATRLNEYNLAIQLFTRSYSAGFKNIDLFYTDHDLDPLREREDFQALMKELEEKKHV